MGIKIRRLREKHGLKQINLANALQVTSQAVSKWEKGASIPDVETLIKIATLFNVSTDFLLGITDKKEHIFEATVLLTGIIGFAKRSVCMKPEDLVQYLNGIFFTITEITLKNDGIPVKYMGDGFLAFFSGPEHSERAINTALSVKETLNEKELIIVLNTGPIYLGIIGHPNYGAKDIIGDSVNRTFLIRTWAEEHAKSGIFFTDEVKDRLTKTLDTSRLRIYLELLTKELNINYLA
ncbi:MAG TPA: helix-turn-helix domain-containing protein [Syntrophorhabdaceae bacterium]|nr:helix-turn-helix domain-containing protein [Syntrophorhabdaceae bacterium]HPP06078.1 helix-turn-helix domain-containing protein [Syntrophorhabdaceae bacterium]